MVAVVPWWPLAVVLLVSPSSLAFVGIPTKQQQQHQQQPFSHRSRAFVMAAEGDRPPSGQRWVEGVSRLDALKAVGVSVVGGGVVSQVQKQAAEVSTVKPCVLGKVRAVVGG